MFLTEKKITDLTVVTVTMTIDLKVGILRMMMMRRRWRSTGSKISNLAGTSLGLRLTLTMPVCVLGWL